MTTESATSLQVRAAIPKTVAIKGSRTTEDFVAYEKAKKRKTSIRKVFRGAVGITGLLVLWHIMSVVYDLQLILPTPLAVLRRVFGMLTLDTNRWLYGPNVYVHLALSFQRAMIGFGLAAALAIPLGLLIGRIPTLREYLAPVITAFYPVPGIAWIPLAILWFGLSDKAVIFVVFMTAFFPLYFSTEAGARQINPLLIDAGRCFGAQKFKLFYHVVLPATVPYITTGMRIGLGGAWRMIVAGEMLASAEGIGYMLMEARFHFRAVDLMTAMILISIIGYLTELLIVRLIEKRTTEKWEVKTS
jgi:ABC-type nitrate/sulfonate/bicarbonate transport system permease component